jgi:hypothetical protein
MQVQPIVTAEKSGFALSFPKFVPRRYRPANLGTWSGHLAFAADLVAALKPSSLVELGTHFGESYFTFCQSILENDISCQCYAVDHWQGESHAGFYSDNVFEDVQAYNDANYSSFSHLLRMSFDEARERFADSSIDLLHIDGLHTYEAVSHDFRSWYPKVREGGIVLLHDIAVQHADFGVWRLWDELVAEFPETFAFHHSWGLGVLRKPGRRREWNDLFETLFERNAEARDQLRRRYVIYSSHLENVFESERRESKSQWTSVQIFRFNDGTYSDAGSQSVRFGDWQTLAFPLPDGSGDGPLRIDPADCPCVIDLQSVTISNQQNGHVLWAGTAEQLIRLGFAGTATPLQIKNGFHVFSYGDDPQIFISDLPEHKDPLVLTIQLRFHRTFEAVLSQLDRPPRSGTTSVQVYTADEGSFSEERTIGYEVPFDEWRTAKLTLREIAALKDLRIDPGFVPCAVEIRNVIARQGGGITWAGCEPKDLRALQIVNATVAPRADIFCLLSPGSDPQIRFPQTAGDRQADSIELTLRITSSPENILGMLAEVPLGDACELRSLSGGFHNLAEERAIAAAQISQLATERNGLQRELQLLEALSAAREKAHEEERLPDRMTIENLRQSLAAIEQQLEAERAVRKDVEESVSWRVTKPLRKLNSLFKQG